MLMIVFRPHTFDSFFSDRFASDAARSSAATASTPCAISRASARLRRKLAGVNTGVRATRVSLMGRITVAPMWSGGPPRPPAPEGGRRYTTLPRHATARSEGIEDVEGPDGGRVSPKIGEVVTRVATEENDLVARRVVRHPAILPRGWNNIRRDLRPGGAVPLPHVAGVDLHLSVGNTPGS